MQKILIFVDWYKPAYKAGGPVQSVINLIEALNDNFLIDVVTSDRDFGDHHSFSNIQFNTWIIDSENVRVNYLSPENHYRKIRKIVKDGNYDRIYLNSFFSYKFSLQPLLISYFSRDKIILAPRGMLGRGALELKSLKKRLFISFYKFLLLDKKILWHATSHQERTEITSEFDNANIKIIPNISKICQRNTSIIRKDPGSVRLCFLSRISPKKNLKWALDFLIKFSSYESHSKILFDIYGPIEDEKYWESCLSVINSNSNLIINYCGELMPDEVGPTISNYHYLFLPTKNENFGHVIAESFMSGRPVLISDQTPWRDLKQMGAGMDFSLDQPEGLSTELISIISLGNDEYEKIIESTLYYFDSKNNRNKIIDSYLEMFSE